MKIHQLSVFRWSTSQPVFWPQANMSAAPFRAEDLSVPLPMYPATSRLSAMLQGTVVRQRARRRPGRVQEEPGGLGTVGTSSSAQSLCP